MSHFHLLLNSESFNFFFLMLNVSEIAGALCYPKEIKKMLQDNKKYIVYIERVNLQFLVNWF